MTDLHAYIKYHMALHGKHVTDIYVVAEDSIDYTIKFYYKDDRADWNGVFFGECTVDKDEFDKWLILEDLRQEVEK